MSLGTMTSISESAGVGPVFIDDVSFPGSSSYTTNGDTGVAAKLQALRGDSRQPISGQVYASGGFVAEYDAFNDKLVVYKEADTAGALVQVTATTNLSGTTFKMTVVSK